MGVIQGDVDTGNKGADDNQPSLTVLVTHIHKHMHEKEKHAEMVGLGVHQPTNGHKTSSRHYDTYTKPAVAVPRMKHSTAEHRRHTSHPVVVACDENSTHQMGVEVAPS